MVNIILVCIANFQEYIIPNIQQLQRLGHKDIYVLTNLCFFYRFHQFENNINLINVDELNDSYEFYSKSELDKNFRGGFWTLTSLRFFYIYECMKKYNISNVIHIENDVLLYYHCNTIIDMFDSSYMYIPFDTFSRNIASIMYIPNASVFKEILDKYDFNTTDMQNFSIIQKQTGLICNLPIFPTCNSSPEHTFVSNNFDMFNGFIFDAAAIGQYLGGVDPQNKEGDTTGFVNETCIIKYNTYSFIWEISDDIKKPFLIIDGIKIPIFNLHIHCKNLYKFM